MTAYQLQHLPQTELGLVWLTLRATQLPVGTFDGVVWPRPVWPVWWRLWRGKVFTGTTVRNRIGPWLLIPGVTSVDVSDVLIDYPQLGIQDRLRPVSQTLWLGRLDLPRPHTVWFSLESVP